MGRFAPLLPPTMSSEPPQAERRALILVVERDPHVRDLEKYFLEKAGYVVEFADDGRTALEAVRSMRPAIVITEILVPGMDGLAVCRAIKEDASLASTPVVVFSILASAERAREAGADAFRLKPLAEETLVQTVEAVLGTHREQDR